MQTHRARHSRFTKPAKAMSGGGIHAAGAVASAKRGVLRHGKAAKPRMGSAAVRPLKVASGSLWGAASRSATAPSFALLFPIGKTVAVSASFKQAAGQAKRVQRLIRQTAAQLGKAKAETTRKLLRPTRPSSRAALWQWYRGRGLSWARFVADHGLG